MGSGSKLGPDIPRSSDGSSGHSDQHTPLGHTALRYPHGIHGSPDHRHWLGLWWSQTSTQIPYSRITHLDMTLGSSLGQELMGSSCLPVLHCCRVSSLAFSTVHEPLHFLFHLSITHSFIVVVTTVGDWVSFSWLPQVQHWNF